MARTERSRGSNLAKQKKMWQKRSILKSPLRTVKHLPVLVRRFSLQALTCLTFVP